jgi:hypothetical protein
MTTITSSTPIETQEQSLDQQPPVLGVQDLQNLLIVVDLASQRGAFRANELSQIGALFDKVNQFVASTQGAQPGQDNQPPTGAVDPSQQAPTPVTPMSPPFAPKVSI